MVVAQAVSATPPAPPPAPTSTPTARATDAPTPAWAWWVAAGGLALLLWWAFGWPGLSRVIPRG